MCCGLLGGLGVAAPPILIAFYVVHLPAGVPYLRTTVRLAVGAALAWYAVVGFVGVWGTSSFWIMHKFDNSIRPPWEHSENERSNNY